MPRLATREVPDHLAERLQASGFSLVEARIYAARGIEDPQELEPEFRHLLPFSGLLNIEAMASALADAIAAQKRILVIADYDADGATACTVAMKGLAAMGAAIDFLVPNRFEYGYGLTPEIVELAAESKPDILLTVDNGIASVAGVERAHQLGMTVLITDHHLPGDVLPAALIVNPNQPGCTFASKNLAGVGVMFYVLLALRAELRDRGAFAVRPEPNLAELLDIVALGTVADVVRLDANNRILVQQGLRRMRAGRMCTGIRVLFEAAGRRFEQASCFDLGFTLGPRLNAAGRLDDMSVGIACLLASDHESALTIARELDQLNRERRNIEAGMQEEALSRLQHVTVGNQYSLSLYDDNWHQGVIGILASRLKERFHRPTLVFADGHEGEIKGSGRSIPGLHLRDALDLVSKRHPDLILKFGGHSAAAGLTIRQRDFEAFQQAFETVCRELIPANALQRLIEVDGELDASSLTLDLAERLDRQVWGQGFPQPQFLGRFKVVKQRVVGEKHLRVTVRTPWGMELEAMRFQSAEPLPDDIDAVYKLSVNEWKGARNLQLLIDHHAEVAR